MFTPTLVNELRLTYLRRKFIDHRPALGTNLAGAIGLRGVNSQAFPAFTIPGYASLSSATVARFQTPILDRQVLESISWSHRKHAFKFGAEFQVSPDRVIAGDTQPLRPFPQFSDVTLINPSIGKSRYHAAFVRVEKRFSSGFSFLGHYTRSRFMDDAESSNEYGNILGVNQTSYIDAYHRAPDWAAAPATCPTMSC